MHSRRIKSLHLVETQPQRSPQILFLHGVLRNWRSYYTVWPALQNGHALAFLDFRGHGESDRADSYFVMDYVHDAVEVLKQFDPPCVVYGHSLGAMVALAAASQLPEHVSRVILEDPPFETMGSRLTGSNFLQYFRGLEECLLSGPYVDTEELFQAISSTVVGTSAQGAAIRLRDTRDETTRRFMAEALFQVDPRVLAPITSGLWLEGYRLPEIVGSVRCPVELLQADARQGGMLVDDDVRLIQQHLGPNCRTTYFPETGHSIHWIKVAEVLKIIGESL